MSTQACSAWRKLQTADNYIEIKAGVPYSVTTGYKLYASDVNYTGGVVDAQGSGATVEMVFEAAVTVAVGAAALISALNF